MDFLKLERFGLDVSEIIYLIEDAEQSGTMDSVNNGHEARKQLEALIEKVLEKENNQ